MDQQLIAAIVTASAMMAGVIAGALLKQAAWRDQQAVIHQRAVMGLVISTLDLRDAFEELSSTDAVSRCWQNGTYMPKRLDAQLELMIKLCMEHEPSLAIPLMWIRETARNFDDALRCAWKAYDDSKNRYDAGVAAELQSAADEVRAAGSQASFFLLRAFAILSWRKRMSLRKYASFRRFLAHQTADLPPVKRFAASLCLYVPPTAY